MYIKYLSIISLLIFPGIELNEVENFSSVEFASTGKDRCSTRDCMCRVTGASTSYYPRDINSNRISLFFSEGSHELGESQTRVLNQFIQKFNGTSHNVSILGYADGCGGAQYNLDLSSRRAREIKSLIRSYSSYPKVFYFGENSSGHNPESRRVDVIVHSEGSIAQRIERIPADFYLLDASGSMSTETWKKLILASKKPNSQVWVSQMSGCYSGQNINGIRPGGGTEIWWAYWTIIDKMSPGQTLLIISDFNSNYPLTRREHYLIEQKVRSAGIRVLTISP